MPTRESREARGVYLDRRNGWVRSVDSMGKERRFTMISTTEDPFSIDVVADAFELDLDAIDPVVEDTTPQPPSAADLRHLRLL